MKAERDLYTAFRKDYDAAMTRNKKVRSQASHVRPHQLICAAVSVCLHSECGYCSLMLFMHCSNS